jgi:hypothetical protein
MDWCTEICRCALCWLHWGRRRCLCKVCLQFYQRKLLRYVFIPPLFKMLSQQIGWGYRNQNNNETKHLLKFSVRPFTGCAASNLRVLDVITFAHFFKSLLWWWAHRKRASLIRSAVEWIMLKGTNRAQILVYPWQTAYKLSTGKGQWRTWINGEEEKAIFFNFHRIRFTTKF